MKKQKTAGASEIRPFSPDLLSRAEIEQVVEYYFGVHPKYFVFEGVEKMKIDVYRIAMDGYDFRGIRCAK